MISLESHFVCLQAVVAAREDLEGADKTQKLRDVVQGSSSHREEAVHMSTLAGQGACCANAMVLVDEVAIRA